MFTNIYRGKMDAGSPSDAKGKGKLQARAGEGLRSHGKTRVFLQRGMETSSNAQGVHHPANVPVSMCKPHVLQASGGLEHMVCCHTHSHPSSTLASPSWPIDCHVL